MKLFAIPYAGASGNIYMDLKNKLRDCIEVIPIDLPGHGRLSALENLSSIEKMADYTYRIIESEICNEDYGIIGFCMGAAISYELYYKLLENNIHTPKWLFLCSAIPANNLEQGKDFNYFEMSDDEMERVLIAEGHVEKEVLSNSEMKEYILPIIRNDFIASQCYVYTKREEKIKANGIVMYSNEETKSEMGLELWNDCFSEQVRYYMIEGEHLFINRRAEKMASIIKKELYM